MPANERDPLQDVKKNAFRFLSAYKYSTIYLIYKRIQQISRRVPQWCVDSETAVQHVKERKQMRNKTTAEVRSIKWFQRI